MPIPKKQTKKPSKEDNSKDIKKKKTQKPHDWESSVKVARQKARNEKNRKEKDWGEEAE